MFGSLSLLWSLTVSAATVPVYTNDSPVVNPGPIDATVFINRSQFTVSTALPYETLNTLYYTNTGSGVMSGTPGFRFLHVTNSTLLPARAFVNQGSITANSYLFIAASNVVNTGPLSVGATGLLHIEGHDVNLTRNGLRTGSPAANSPFFGVGCSFTSFASNYFNDASVTDLYWGNGTNNYLNNNTAPVMPLNQGNFTLPSPYSPTHQVIEPLGGFNFTNFVSVGAFGFLGGFGSYYDAFVFTNRISPTRTVVQVVFAPTNTFDTNFSTKVRFYPEADSGATAVIEFSSVDFDIVLNTYTTNTVYLLDSLAFQTNLFLGRNAVARPVTRRPNTFAVTQFLPCQFSNGSTNNAVFTPDLIYNPSYFSNAVPMLYAGYSAGINIASTPGGLGTTGDPATFAGRVEIIGENLNLDQTRVRAESTISIRTGNLSSNKVAKVDAPFLIYDLTSIQPQLIITNLAPPSVHRLSGSLAAWSGTWKNYQTNNNGTTNEILFHVLIAESGLQFAQAVVVDSFKVKAPNLAIDDPLNIRTTMRLDATGLSINKGLTLPVGAGWGNSNVLNVLNFTNNSFVNISQSANFGADRSYPYANYINRGTNTAASHFISALNFENPGCVQSSGGILSLAALHATFLGGPTTIFTNVSTNFTFQFPAGLVTNVTTNVFTNSLAAKLISNSDLDINADDLTVSNSYFQAGSALQGALRMAVTNRLMDAGQDAINIWSVSAGFEMLRRPANSDLLATYIRSFGGFGRQIEHSWSAEDRGATAAGFSNNLALGKLVLDGEPLTLFHFAGAGGGVPKALYVDYLELVNNATNYNTGVISIDPSITLYFANANIPPSKLDKSNNGRLRWVKNFTGPLSSTNIVYPSGRTYTFNLALVTSKDLDSDGDGTVNANDATPIYTEESAVLRIALSKGNPPKALVSWDALAKSTNHIEYRVSAVAPWQTLTNNIVIGPVNVPFTVQDPVNGGNMRTYRLRVETPQP